MNKIEYLARPALMKFSTITLALAISVCIATVCFAGADVNVTPDQESGRIRGLVKPENRAVISSEIPARIISLPVDMGERFKKGDLLVKFDCSLYNAELASARAEYHARKKRMENNERLLELNAISAIDVEISRAEVEKANADVEIARIQASRCIVNAPYDGRVTETLVNEYESVGRDQELMSILDDRNLEIELIVPSTWLTWLEEGIEFRFVIDETQTEYQAYVSRLSAVIDPVSQTIRITGKFKSGTNDILSGMSGSAFFDNNDI